VLVGNAQVSFMGAQLNGLLYPELFAIVSAK
jgi:hypothetical protein